MPQDQNPSDMKASQKPDYVHQPVPVSSGTVAAAPYSNRPPSPPYIHVPTVMQDESQDSLHITPSFDGIDTSSLTKEDLAVITQNQIHMARDNAMIWRYESRRKAQPILDFLYLGPSSVAKDSSFLQKEGITMLLAARDSSMAEARLMSVEKTAQALGLETVYIDVNGRQELIRNFDTAVRKINDHLIRIYQGQALPVQEAESRLEDGQIMIDNANFKRGKVLVFCETGNDRSAAIVAAYIMQVFGMDLIKTLQFVGLQRFCTNFDEDTKQLLRSYEDILLARREVARMRTTSNETHFAASGQQMRTKRGIEETMEIDDESVSEGFALDRDRYMDRPAFVPFVEGDGDALDTTMGDD